MIIIFISVITIEGFTTTGEPPMIVSRYVMAVLKTTSKPIDGCIVVPIKIEVTGIVLVITVPEDMIFTPGVKLPATTGASEVMPKFAFAPSGPILTYGLYVIVGIGKNQLLETNAFPAEVLFN